MNLDQLKKLQAQVTPAPWKVAGLSLKHDHAPEPPNTTEQANQQRHAMRIYLAQSGVFQCTNTLIDALITLFTNLERRTQ